MINQLVLLAQRGADSPANVWLKEHPLYLGLIALGLGFLLVISGMITLRSGVTRNRIGMEFRGPTAAVSGVVRVAIGLGVCVFGLYKIFAG